MRITGLMQPHQVGIIEADVGGTVPDGLLAAAGAAGSNRSAGPTAPGTRVLREMTSVGIPAACSAA